MTTSNPKEAYVWVWLPSSSEPVVAGKIYTEGKKYNFVYGQSYLERKNAISLFLNELPLRQGMIEPAVNLEMAGCLRDASPDAWGRRVIIHRRHGANVDISTEGELDELTYLLESGSDRIGMLDFQRSSTIYEPRQSDSPTLEDLMEAASRVEQGLPINPALEKALLHGSSIGGARPKSLIETDNKKYIAKFSSSNDIYNVVKAEFIAMRLAGIVGIDVAPTKLVNTSGKDVLLIERFDRMLTHDNWERRGLVSALTLLKLNEMEARYASYTDLAEIIRREVEHPKQTLKELFSRMTFNVLCGNNDDHARNHAFFWDGSKLSLTPAYDICPQNRTGQESSQAMKIFNEDNHSRFSTCLNAANQFLLNEKESIEIIINQVNNLLSSWETLCDEAEFSPVDRRLFVGRQILISNSHPELYEVCVSTVKSLATI